MNLYLGSSTVQKHLQGSKCLEWCDRPKSDRNCYMSRMPGCTSRWGLTYRDGNIVANSQRQLIYGSVYDVPRLQNFAGYFDMVFFVNVLEHLEYPREGAKAIYQLVRPGGTAIVSAPCHSQYHGVPSDYYRFTKTGLVSVMVQAGFCVPDHLTAGGGDSVIEAAASLGFTAFDFALQDLDRALRFGSTNITDNARMLYVVALRPPSALC